jgi:hypothetical protein
MKWNLCFIAVVVVVVWLQSGFSEASNADLNKSDDGRALLEMSDKWIGVGKKVVMRHGSSYREFSSEVQLEQMGLYLSKVFGLEAGAVALNSHGMPKYTSVRIDDEGLQTSLILLGMENGTTYLMLKLEAGPDSAAAYSTERILERRGQLNETLSSVGIAADWNVMVQGEMLGEQTDELAKGEIAQLLKSEISEEMVFKQLEKYEDARTISLSLYTPMFRKSVRSGDHLLNLQAAAHKDTDTAKWRITIGTPLITIEY